MGFFDNITWPNSMTYQHNGRCGGKYGGSACVEYVCAKKEMADERSPAIQKLIDHVEAKWDKLDEPVWVGQGPVDDPLN